MSTPSERKLVTFLRKLQNGGLDGNPLSYIQKIYSDRPHSAAGRTTFPRVQVKELGAISNFSGIGATDRIYEVNLEVTVYVDMKSPLDYATVSGFWAAPDGTTRNLSPEEAVGAIAYHISKELAENKATLHTDNSHKFLLRGNASFNDKGVDNTYFSDLSVYKGSITFNFFLRD